MSWTMRGMAQSAVGHPQHARSRRGTPTALSLWYLPLVACALLCLGIAILLSVAPLWETADTYCQTVVSPTNGCPDVLSRRRHWVFAVLAVGLIFAFLAVVARRGRGRRSIDIRRMLNTAILLTAVGLGIGSGAFLVVGSSNDYCGSTLSRLDDDSSYDSARHQNCAPTLAADRQDAWVLALIALAVFSGASWSQVRHEASMRSVQTTDDSQDV
jgi:hypothetical protein